MLDYCIINTILTITFFGERWVATFEGAVIFRVRLYSGYGYIQGTVTFRVRLLSGYGYFRDSTVVRVQNRRFDILIDH